MKKIPRASEGAKDPRDPIADPNIGRALECDVCHQKRTTYHVNGRRWRRWRICALCAAEIVAKLLSHSHNRS